MRLVTGGPGEGAAPALSAADLLAAVPGLDEAGVELRQPRPDQADLHGLPQAHLGSAADVADPSWT
jgi:hypothetical protein